MAKQTWKPGNMIYPIPAVMVSVTDGKGQDDIITVAWTGTICNAHHDCPFPSVPILRWLIFQ